MDTPITPLSSGAPKLELANPFLKESYSEEKESSSKSTLQQDDGGVSTQLAYSRQRSSYTLSISQIETNGDNSGSNVIESSSQYQHSLTYTHLSSYYRYSSNMSNTATLDSKVASGADAVAPSTAVGATDEAPALLDGAATILRFIEQRIASEKAEGADEAELAALWEQGLKGFVQGFNEAIDILEDLGQLSAEVQDSVQTLSKQVYAGFDAIYAQYISDDKPAASAADNAEGVAASDVTAASAQQINPNNPGNGLRQSLSSNGRAFEGGFAEQFKSISSSDSAISKLVDSLGNVDANVEYGRKDRFQFELTTLDGDTISIEASSTHVFYGEYDANGDKETAFIEGMKDKNAFAINIEGDLDEAEKGAITDLLQQIMSLADEFYNGDVEKAYEAAMELGYDQNEIASYSLKLRQVEQYSVAAAYQTTAVDTLPADARDAFSTIGDFAQNVLESLYKPDNYTFFDYTQLLKGISEQIDKQIASTDSQSFSDRLAQLVDTVSLPNSFADGNEDTKVDVEQTL